MSLLVRLGKTLALSGLQDLIPIPAAHPNLEGTHALSQALQTLGPQDGDDPRGVEHGPRQGDRAAAQALRFGQAIELAQQRREALSSWSLERLSLSHPENASAKGAPGQRRDLSLHALIEHTVTQRPMAPWRHGPLRDGVLDQCMEREVTPLAWSPFGGGVLGMTQGEALQAPGGERLAALLGKLDGLAEAQGLSRSAVALAWTMLHPSGVIPILGTQRLERLRECMGALEVRMSRGDWNQILEAAQGERLP